MTDENNPADQELEDTFGDLNETVIAEPESEVVAEPEVKGETVDTEVEAPAETEIKADSAPPAEEKESKLVPIAALHDERRKAKQLKEENDSLRQHLPKNEEAPDPYEDIDLYNSYMKNKWNQEQRVEQQKVNDERITASRSRMLEAHDDFIEMENIFGIMTASDPELMTKMLASGNEVDFAYNAAKAFKASVIGGVAPAKETTETVEPSETELRNKSAIDVPNLASATAQASNTPQAEKEADIDDIFADVKY